VGVKSNGVDRVARPRLDEPPPAGEPTLTIEAQRWTDALQRVVGASDQLTALIRDLLDISRIQRGGFEITPERVDLRELVASSVESSRVRMASGEYPDGVELMARLPDDPHYGSWDPVRLEQVLVNVLDNALKYSKPGGSVQLDVWREEDEARIRIADDGIGIAAQKLEAIFEPFSRASNAESDGYPGFGIGLAICREIVSRHGGRIWASSDGMDHGSQFDIVLPGLESD
jgi:signal transduction histidine kinase